MELDLEKIQEFIAANPGTIALEFHSSIVTQGISILQMLETAFPDTKFVIIGESPFPSCCVDYISAKHITTSGIIHFGHICVPASPIPMLHIPEVHSFSLEPLKEKLDDLSESVHVHADQHNEAMKHQVEQVLQEANKTVASIEEAKSIVYLGEGYSIPSLIRNSHQEVFTLGEQGLQKHNPYVFISKRYHYISQVKDSEVFGILILSIPLYNQVSKKIKGLLASHNKSAYPIYLGKINTLKLGNFSEVDMFVVVGCPHLELPDNSELYKPVITPFELEVGLKGNWDGTYSTEFEGMEYTQTSRNAKVADRFTDRDFKGLEPSVEGVKEIEEGYNGIAQVYHSELNN